MITRLSPPKFEIFLIFPLFLRSNVLSRLATLEATHITSLLILDIIFWFTCGELDLYRSYFVAIDLEQLEFAIDLTKSRDLTKVRD